MINIALKRGNSDKESKTLLHYTVMHDDIKLHYFDKAEDVPEGYIPAGVIDWVISVLGITPACDDYPSFLSHLLGRKIWRLDEWPMEAGIFIKPFDKPKRFEARITTGGYKGKKKPPYICSEIVHFTNEWRLYVVNGKVVYTGWYQGNDDDAIAPDFDDNIIPDEWCGVIDMGTTNDGKYLLVEANEPYSVGWYGTFNECAIYTDFIVRGWDFLLKWKDRVQRGLDNIKY